jgi:PAS domain S-box-containing protein
MKIGTKLTAALLLAALLPMTILTLLDYRATRQALIHEAREGLIAEADLHALSFDRFISSRLTALQTEAKLSDLGDFLSRTSNARSPGTSAYQHAMAALTAFAGKDLDHTRAFGLLDESGINVLDVNEEMIGIDESRWDHFRRPMETNTAHVSLRFGPPPKAEDPGLLFSAVVRDRQGTVLGVLRVHYDPDILQEIIVRNTREQEAGAFAVLLDEHHVRLAHSTRPDRLFKAVLAPRPARIEKLQKARRMRSGPVSELSTDQLELARGLHTDRARWQFNYEDESLSGENELAAAAVRLESLPWVVVLAKPASSFLTRIHEQLQNTLFLGFLVVILVAAAAIGFARVFARPILKLTEAAKKVTQGEVDTVTEVRTRDELGVLTDAFNAMTHRVSSTLEESAREIAERKTVEEALRESESRLRNVYETAPLAFVIWDHECRITHWNDRAEEMFGWTKKEALGRNFFEFLIPDRTRIQVEKVVEALLRGEVQRHVINENLTKSGAVILCEWNNSVLFDRSGRVMGAISMALDITERRQAEERARLAQERLLEQQRSETERVQRDLDKVREQLINQTRLATIGQVAGSIAHELRNPLGAARNAAYYLKHYGPRNEHDLKENLDLIDVEINTAHRIINDMMNMVRASPPSKQVVEVKQIIQEALARVGLSEEIACRITVNPDPFRIEADSVQLRQVLFNLVTNAAQAIGREGEIRIDAVRTDDWDEITVRDDGPGIPAGDSDQVFEPLFTTRAKGTGLGLTVCREIVERHGGMIELLHDDRPGTAFRVRLPRLEQRVERVKRDG